MRAFGNQKDLPNIMTKVTTIKLNNQLINQNLKPFSIHLHRKAQPGGENNP